MERGIGLKSIKLTGVEPKRAMSGIGRILIQVIHKGKKDEVRRDRVYFRD